MRKMTTGFSPQYIDNLRAENARLRKALESLADEMQVAFSSGDSRPAQWFERRIAKARAALQ